MKTLLRTIAVAGALFSIAAPAAEAGVYTVHSCRTPDGARGDAAEWETRGGDPAIDQSGSVCPSGYFWLDMVSGVPHPADDAMASVFRAAPDTTIRSYRIWRSAQVSYRFTYDMRELYTGPDRAVVLDQCYGSAGCRTLGNRDNPFSAENLVGRTAAGNLVGVELFMTCYYIDSSAEPCAAATPAARVQVHRADFELNDSLPPVLVKEPSGALVTDGSVVRGVTDVTVEATDRGGGVYLARIEIDGKVAAETVLDNNGGLCGEPFTRRQPCKAAARGTLEFDTRQLPDGKHAVRVLVTDATRTNITASSAARITTDNIQDGTGDDGPGNNKRVPPPSTCDAEPRTNSLQLSAWARDARNAKTRPRRSLRIRHGLALTAGGRLTTALGAPVAGAEVCILDEWDTDSASPRFVGKVVTDAAGDFLVTLPPGPSRRLWFVQRSGGESAVATVDVRVPAPLRLSASRQRFRVGQTLVLSGSLQGEPHPRRGVVVVLQARQRGSWITFGTTRSREDGRFRFAYRFRNTIGTRRYPMRAVVPRQGHYPYDRGQSRTIRVRVRG